MKIYETESLEEKTSMEPGTILDVSKNGVKVACKDSVLIIKKVQFPNGKPLTIEQYINGHEIEKNIVLK
jgi:methionyl-tRNA formyltransferase